MNGSIAHTPPAQAGDDAKVAAKQLEAYFLRRILSEVGPSGAYGGDGVAGSTFRGMFEDALADAVSETGQVGLAETIVGSLAGPGGRRATPDATAGAVWVEVQDPEALADAALAERLRAPQAEPTALDEDPLNTGRNRTSPTDGGE